MDIYGRQKKRATEKEYDEILRYEDNASKLLKTDFYEELKYFKEIFRDDEDCRKALIAKRGWRLRKDGLLDCICPKCGEAVLATNRVRSYERKVNDRVSEDFNTVERIQYRCSRSECRKEFNVATGTLFAGYTPKMWLCFLSLYCMALLNGKVPKTYLIKEHYNILVNNDELSTSLNDAELKIQDYKNIGDQVRRITKNIIPLFEKTKQKQKRECFRFVGLEKTFLSSYLDWYSANRNEVKGWKMSWTPGPCSVENDIAMAIAENRKLENVYDVQYLRKMEVGLKNTWVLCFELYQKRREVENIRWLHVDRYDRVDFPKISILLSNDSIAQGSQRRDLPDEKTQEYLAKQREIKTRFAKFQIIQVLKNAKFLQRPFRITNDFRDAFSESVLEYRRSNFMKLSQNNIFSCPEEILHNTANYMSKKVERNMNIKGSSFE